MMHAMVQFGWISYLHDVSMQPRMRLRGLTDTVFSFRTGCSHPLGHIDWVSSVSEFTYFVFVRVHIDYEF